MADVQLQNFGKRLNRINRRHEQLSQGYVNVVMADGQIVAQPRRVARARFPLRAVALVATLFFVLKAFLVAGLGEEQFAERTARLQAGTPVEQLGGWVMQPDPLTLWVAEQLGAIL